MKEAANRPTSGPAVTNTRSKPRAVDRDASFYVQRHLRFGWWALLVFLTMGMVLEYFHGFKVQWYLETSNETRRLMWTLGHAHGTLLALVNIVFGATAAFLPNAHFKARPLASACLVSATLLVPGGFILGGLVVYGGDPGLGILLLPVGAFLLLAGVFLVARSTRGRLSDLSGKTPK